MIKAISSSVMLAFTVRASKSCTSIICTVVSESTLVLRKLTVLQCDTDKFSE